MILNFSNQPIKKNMKSIFLAGPTLRGKPFIESWRKKACSSLEKLGFDGLVYIPEFESGNMQIDLTEQANWEREGLQNATVILFYIPRKLPELPGFTTNVEFGMWLAKKPDACRLCIPEDAEKVNYLKWLWNVEVPDMPIYTDLDTALSDIVLNQF